MRASDILRRKIAERRVAKLASAYRRKHEKRASDTARKWARLWSQIELATEPAIGEGDVISKRKSTPLVHANAKVRWAHVANVGSWKGYHGGALELTPDHFREAVKNFDAQQNAVTITFGHPDYVEDGNAVIAAGWIHQLAAVDGATKLYALAEWTDDTAKMIDEGKMRFCSIVMLLNAIDKVSAEEIGARLYELGLTNQPFIDGLTPLRLMEARPPAGKGNVKMDMTDAELLQEAIKTLGADKTMAEYMKWIDAKRALAAVETGGDAGGDAGGTGGDPAAAGDKTGAGTAKLEGTPETDALSAIAQSIAAATNLSVEEVIGRLQEKVDQVAALVGDNAAPTDQAATATAAAARERALHRKVAELSTKVEKYERADREARATRAASLVDAAIKDGRYLEEDRAVLLKLSEESPKVFETWVSRKGKADKVEPKNGADRQRHRPTQLSGAAPLNTPKLSDEEVDAEVAKLSEFGQAQFSALLPIVKRGRLTKSQALAKAREFEEGHA